MQCAGGDLHVQHSCRPRRISARTCSGRSPGADRKKKRDGVFQTVAFSSGWSWPCPDGGGSTKPRNKQPDRTVDHTPAAGLGQIGPTAPPCRRRRPGPAVFHLGPAVKEIAIWMTKSKHSCSCFLYGMVKSLRSHSAMTRAGRFFAPFAGHTRPAAVLLVVLRRHFMRGSTDMCYNDEQSCSCRGIISRCQISRKAKK
jgi:hypothetical protein